VAKIRYAEIEGYNGYYRITDNGELHNPKKRMKTYRLKCGYDAIILTFNKKRKHFLIHRLVATYFISNPDNKKEVNHKDCNKLNNNVCNLEWVTSSENQKHAVANGRCQYLFDRPNTLGKKHKSTVSKYHNVGWDKSRSKWIAKINVKGKSMFMKRFDDENSAALHVNWIIQELKLTDRPFNVIS
jgi:hypothetical protein